MYKIKLHANFCTDKELYDTINPECYIKIDLKNPEEALGIIKTSIENNEWEKRIGAIKKEKKLVVKKLNFLNVINNAIQSKKYEYNFNFS